MARRNLSDHRGMFRDCIELKLGEIYLIEKLFMLSF